MAGTYREDTGVRSPLKIPTVEFRSEAFTNGRETTTANTRKQNRSKLNLLPALLVAVSFVVSLSAIMITGAPVGSEFQVNTYYTGDQETPSVTMSPNGNFVVTWNSWYQETSGSGCGVYAQRFSSDGNKLGTEFQVNTYVTDDQKNPSIASDSNGKFTIVWQSAQDPGATYGIYMQAFNANGNSVGSERRVNTYTSDDQYDPAIAMAPDGRSLVVWTSVNQDLSNDGIYGQFFDSSGNPFGNEFRVNTYTSNYQDLPAAAMDSTGRSVVVWRSMGQDLSVGGIYSQRYNSSGEANGTEFQVNTWTSLNQGWPSVAMEPDGDFIVVWASNGQDSSMYGVYGQRFASDGTPVGSEFRVNTHTSGSQWYPCVATNSTGAFVVAWVSDAQDGSSSGIFGQKYDSTGNPFEDEFQVNTYTSDAQTYPCVAMRGTGDFVVVWQSYGQDSDLLGIFGQLYDTTPIPEFAEIALPIAGTVAFFCLIRRNKR